MRTHPPAPPSGPKANSQGLSYPAGKSPLYAMRGMNILGSRAQAYLIRRAQGVDAHRWVARNK